MAPRRGDGAHGPIRRPKPRGHSSEPEDDGGDGDDGEVVASGLLVPTRRIARRLGMGRNAVRRWLCAGEAAPYCRAPGRSVLDRHLGHVERRWADGRRNAAALWRELREGRGFVGGYDVVRRWAIRQR